MSSSPYISRSREFSSVASDGHLIIRVCEQSRTTILYENLILDLKPVGGHVYYQVQYGDNQLIVNDTQGGSPYRSDLDTQRIDTEMDDSVYTTPDDPVDVVRMAGGGFEDVNEKHASMLEMIDDIDDVSKELNYLECGDTMLDDDTIELYARWCSDSPFKMEQFF